MELLTFTIAAGETKEFRKSGRYIEVIDAASALTLLLFGEGGGQTDDATNALSGIFIEGFYSAFQVRSAAAQTITLLIHDGRGGSRRQPGVVQVVDGGRARTLADQSAIASARALASVGNLSIVQLWNPVGSGRRIVIKKMIVSSPTAGLLLARATNAAQTTLIGSPYAKRDQASVAAFGFQAREGVAVATPGVSAFFVVVQASAPFVLDLEEPIVIGPGFGIDVCSGVNNQEVFASWDFTHEAV